MSMAFKAEIYQAWPWIAAEANEVYLDPAKKLEMAIAAGAGSLPVYFDLFWARA
jgi:hypothetical protein